MNRRSEDAGDVPWPALVDLLTSVLITFMFFILVTTVAMSAMTIKQADTVSKGQQKSGNVSESTIVSSTMPEINAQSSPLTISGTIATSSTLLPPPSSAATVESEADIQEGEATRLKTENELLKQQLAAMGATFAKSKEIKTIAEPAENAVTLLFNPNEAGMLPQVEQTLVKFMKDAATQLGKNTRLQITASEPAGVSFSQARERALSRAMVVRNVLLENGLDPAAVSFRYDAGARFKSHNWVRIQAMPSAGAPE